MQDLLTETPIKRMKRLDRTQKEEAEAWFKTLQTNICTTLEAWENQFFPHLSEKFLTKTWSRPGGGGGTMALLQGSVFEKAGVNRSAVWNIQQDKNAPNLWASGLSVVIHPKSPTIPAIHMNTRVMEGNSVWFGGGIDLTPCLANQKELVRLFHSRLKKTCDHFDPNYYKRFKKWADDYFFLPHRNEPRGAGGIFYDNLALDWHPGFSFTQAVGESFLPIYADIVKSNQNTPWTDQDKQKQLEKRARYAEFNLLYDRGTQFGLKTQGACDAIFMSLPPLASWPSPLHTQKSEQH